MIYLAEKAPADVVDYNLNMSEFVPAGFSIDNTLTVEIEDAGNGESPLALEAFDVSAQPAVEGGEDNICIVLWLRGGTAGVRYQGRIAFNDNQSSDPDRTYERLFQVEVLPL
jgi:hypothetical protein